MAAIKFFLTLIIIFYLYTRKNVAEATRHAPRNSLPQFPAIFIIGDSVMDTGNNNHIHTLVKANYPPYGQNYTDHLATGRFSNGRLLSDMLASVLGIKEALPPYLDPTLSDQDLTTGVNFASAGSGHDDLTSVFSLAIPVSKQIDNFKEYINRLQHIVGPEKATEIIKNALVVVSAGTNDWFFNFYDIPARKAQYDVNGYQDFLQDRLQTFIEELYGLGCRSIIVSGLPPIGCLPAQMILSLELPNQRHCIEDQNTDSQLYNQKLIKMLSQLQPNLPGLKLVYNDLYTPVMDVINKPQNYGILETKKTCCPCGPDGLALFCIKSAEACENPDQFLFWDTIHPTFAGYQPVFNSMVKNVLPQFF